MLDMVMTFCISSNQRFVGKCVFLVFLFCVYVTSVFCFSVLCCPSSVASFLCMCESVL